MGALATKVSESRPDLSAQAIGSALFGLQKLSSEALEVRTLVAALAEKVEVSTVGLDAQAIGNALFGKVLSIFLLFSCQEGVLTVRMHVNRSTAYAK